MSFKLKNKFLSIICLTLLLAGVYFNNISFVVSDELPKPIDQPVSTPPFFGINGTASTATTGDTFLFSINVTDNVSVNAVSVNYTWPEAGQWFNKTMENIGGAVYNNISQMPTINTTITYYFWAINATDFTNTSGPGFVTVIDNDAPVPISGSGDFTVLCSTPFSIYANFTDNINVTSAKIYYRNASNATYRNTDMTEHATKEGVFSVTNSSMGLNINISTENISYYVIGYDDKSNQNKYNDTGGEDWNITVIDDIAPVPIAGTGDMNTGTGDYFEIKVNFTDNINVTRAVIHYKHQTGAQYFRCNMTPTGVRGDFDINILNLSEACGISTINSTTPVVYHILGFDDFNNSGNYSNSTKDWVITVEDNDNPEIINGTQDFTVTTGEPFMIYANFTDNIEISHADIFYKRKGSQDPFFTKAMQEVDGKKGCFYVTDNMLGLDTLNDDTAIWYYVWAYDKTGNQKQYTKPGTWWKITIIDNDAPAFNSGDGNITIGTGDNFLLEVNFTDNIQIKFIRFYYKNELWDHWEFNEFSVDDTNDDRIWEFKISSSALDVAVDTANDDSDYFYYIRAFDARAPIPNYYNYSSNTKGFKITVLDDDAPASVTPLRDAGSGNFKATTGEKFTIYANFTDNIKVDHAELFIRKHPATAEWPPGMNMLESAAMPGRFYITNLELNISTMYNTTDYEYYVVCYDTAGNYFRYEIQPNEPFTITVIDNDKPVVIAGEDVVVEEGSIVQLHGNKSYDNIGIVSYHWSFKYDRLDQLLEGVKTSFKFEKLGTYKIELTATDAQGNEGVDDLIITVIEKNYPPEIEAVTPEDGDKIYVFNPNLNIYVRFTEDMDIDETNIDFFFINDSSGTPVPGTFDWFVDDVKEIYQLSFIPDDQLQYDETYTLTITKGVQEKFAAGFYLKAGKTWSFSTYPEDSDHDSLPDWWEIKFFTSINEAGPDADDDNDGFTNYEEYLGQDGKPGNDDWTHPKDRHSHPAKKEEDTNDRGNVIAVAVLLLIVVLLLIIIMLVIMVRKKKKAEAEEEKKPKVIEHEILFEGGKGLPQVPQEGIEGLEGEALEEPGKPTGPDTELQVQVEPGLEPAKVPGQKAPGPESIPEESSAFELEGEDVGEVGMASGEEEAMPEEEILESDITKVPEDELEPDLAQELEEDFEPVTDLEAEAGTETEAEAEAEPEGDEETSEIADDDEEAEE